MIINLDLDGVFADMDEVVNRLINGSYSSNPSLFWNLVDSHDNFFLHLNPIKESIELFNFIKYNSIYPIRILTALPIPTNKLISAAEDKKNWVAKYLCPDIEVICVNNWSNKKDYCSMGDILIDDSSRNILDWGKSGGIGILHSRNIPLDTIYRLKDLHVFN